MKALLDRQTCLLRNFVDTLNPTSLIDGRRMALVMTAQGPIEGNADRFVRAYDRILRASCAMPDLEGIDRIQARHVSEAIQYRTCWQQ